MKSERKWKQSIAKPSTFGRAVHWTHRKINGTIQKKKKKMEKSVFGDNSDVLFLHPFSF